jgi:CheY-like chemotaxis protein
MPSAARASQVLIVEDDAALREVYADALAAEGYDVQLASDGNEALAILSDVPEDEPCAVLLDLRMPGMNGWELADRLHNSPRWQELPIVVVAAHYLVADEARRIGAAAWLQKPVALERLISAVRGICGPLAGSARPS